MENLKILKELANPRRMAIMRTLHNQGQKSVSQINKLHPDLSQSALSQHLARLREAKVVETIKDSQTVYYSVANNYACLSLLAWAEDNLQPEE